MNKGRWEAVHWCTLMIPYSRINCHIRSQVSAQKAGEKRSESIRVWISSSWHMTNILKYKQAENQEHEAIWGLSKYISKQLWIPSNMAEQFDISTPCKSSSSWTTHCETPLRGSYVYQNTQSWSWRRNYLWMSLEMIVSSDSCCFLVWDQILCAGISPVQ